MHCYAHTLFHLVQVSICQKGGVVRIGKAVVAKEPSNKNEIYIAT